MARTDKDRIWDVHDRHGSTEWEKVPIILMMDIRDELKQLVFLMQQVNARLSCGECLAIPRILKRISANTAKPRKAKA